MIDFTRELIHPKGIAVIIRDPLIATTYDLVSRRMFPDVPFIPDHEPMVIAEIERSLDLLGNHELKSYFEYPLVDSVELSFLYAVIDLSAEHIPDHYMLGTKLLEKDTIVFYAGGVTP